MELIVREDVSNFSLKENGNKDSFGFNRSTEKSINQGIQTSKSMGGGTQIYIDEVVLQSTIPSYKDVLKKDPLKAYQGGRLKDPSSFGSKLVIDSKN